MFCSSVFSCIANSDCRTEFPSNNRAAHLEFSLRSMINPRKAVRLICVCSIEASRHVVVTLELITFSGSKLFQYPPFFFGFVCAKVAGSDFTERASDNEY